MMVISGRTKIDDGEYLLGKKKKKSNAVCMQLDMHVVYCIHIYFTFLNNVLLVLHPAMALTVDWALKGR